MIDFLNIGKSYNGVPAISNLNLKIQQGEFVVLIGPSGSGKSTLLKMINRMIDHDTGKILLNGREIYAFKVRDLRLAMGYAIQSVGLFPHWNVARNIATVPQMLRWAPEKIAQRVDSLLQLFQLDPTVYRTRYPHQLSGGQQQRIGVARALAADPEVLLMDEPFGALDPATRSALQHEMKRVHAASGKTVVLVTHDIDEALFLATKIVLLNKGRIEQVGSPLELLSAPANDFVVDFLGRSDIGIKLLSLQIAADWVRPEPAGAGAAVSSQATLREVLSVLTLRAVDKINVSHPDGSHAGVLHGSDIFKLQGTKAPTGHHARIGEAL